MLKKSLGFLLIVIGAIMVIISILALVKAFDLFTNRQNTGFNYGYAFGSILFPLLLTVCGRWVYRMGKQYARGKNTA